MLVVTVLVDGGDQDALGTKEAICNLLERVRAYKVREVKKPPARQPEQLSFTKTKPSS